MPYVQQATNSRFAFCWNLTGGFDLALQRCGFKTAWGAENNAQCNSVRRRHFPDEQTLTDIRDAHSARYLDNAVKEWYTPLVGNSYSPEEKIMAGTLRKLTKAQAEECVHLYDMGMSLGPIAKYFGVSRQAMWELLKKRTTMRPQKRTGKDNHFYRDGGRADGHAQNLAEIAIQQGILQRSIYCEQCKSFGRTLKDGRSSIHCHHDDYNKPLDVRWLCHKCHYKWHKTHTPKRKEVQKELANVDLITAGFP